MGDNVPDPSMRARPQSPLVVHHNSPGGPFGPEGPLDAEGRIARALVAVPFGLLATWMAWIVTEFLRGDDWFTVIVRCVLGEFILAVALFSLVLLAVAVAPSRLSDALRAVGQRIVHRITLSLSLFGAVLLFLFGAAVLTSVLAIMVAAWREMLK